MTISDESRSGERRRRLIFSANLSPEALQSDLKLYELDTFMDVSQQVRHLETTGMQHLSAYDMLYDPDMLMAD